MNREGEIALDEAAEQRERAVTLVAMPYRWEAALAASTSALKRAEALIVSGGDLIDPDLTRRTRRLAARLEADERNRFLLAATEEIRLEASETKAEANQFSSLEMAPRYRQVFAASGLVHELVITWPAGGGYGGPTAYFIVQACALLVERGPLGARLGLARGWRGRLFAIAAVAGPVPWLFPRAFLEQVIAPMLQAIGGVF